MLWSSTPDVKKSTHSAGMTVRDGDNIYVFPAELLSELGKHTFRIVSSCCSFQKLVVPEKPIRPTACHLRSMRMDLLALMWTQRHSGAEHWRRNEHVCVLPSWAAGLFVVAASAPVSPECQPADDSKHGDI
jgi:hypothetical protein